MKKKIALSIVAFLFSNFINAQTWQWAKSAGGPASDFIGSSVTDAQGNLYVTGCFNNVTITFGSITLTSVNSFDIFIVKYDHNGNVLWAKSAGGNHFDVAQSIACDGSGNVYVVGHFHSTSIAFGTIVLNNPNPFIKEMFIAKYDSSGNPLWAHRYGGSADDYAMYVTVDASSNVYMAGAFASSSVTFGTTTLVNVNGGFVDISITKFDSSGTVLWAKRAGGNNEDYVYSLLCDTFGNLFVAGSFYSQSATFGTTTLTNFDTTESTTDLYVAKYSSNGNFLWARGSGGIWYDEGCSVTTDASGNAYITGSFESDSIMFGATTLINADTGGYGVDLFITKFDGNGNVLWARRGGSIGIEGGIAITTNTSGEMYLGGYFWSDSLNLGGVTLYNDTLNTSDLFIMKLDSTGNTLWATNAGCNGGAFNDQAGTIASYASEVYFAGEFQSPSVPFGADTVYNSNPSSPDIFIVQITDTLACSASFSLVPDTSMPHYYWAINYASGTPPLSYDWDWGDGSPHDFIAYPSHTYTTAGFYTICLTTTDATSCTNTVCQTNLLQIAPNSAAPMTMVQVNVVASIPTAVVENKIEKNISIFPNPTITEVTLNFGKAGRYDVQFCNTLGECVKHLTLNLSPKGEGLSASIDVSELAPGIYYVSVRDGENNLVVRRIVKM